MIKNKFETGKGTKGSIVPKIIAEKGHCHLLVEIRPKFNPLLIKKLEDVVYNDDYLVNRSISGGKHETKAEVS